MTKEKLKHKLMQEIMNLRNKGMVEQDYILDVIEDNLFPFIEELEKEHEWHYVSKKDYPKDLKDIWICFITEEDMKDYVRGWYEYDIDLDEHYFKTSNDFGIATIKNVYAWMPLVPPKEIE